jgi:hypothetical protein
MKEARARRDLIAGELAAGRNPAETLQAQHTERKTVADVHETWLEAKRLRRHARKLRGPVATAGTDLRQPRPLRPSPS